MGSFVEGGGQIYTCLPCFNKRELDADKKSDSELKHNPERQPQWKHQWEPKCDCDAECDIIGDRITDPHICTGESYGGRPVDRTIEIIAWYFGNMQELFQYSCEVQ